MQNNLYICGTNTQHTIMAECNEKDIADAEYTAMAEEALGEVNDIHPDEFYEEAKNENSLESEEPTEESAPQEGHRLKGDDGAIIVRVGNFIVLKDTTKENPYITVAPISRDWYVGYGPGSMVREYLDTTLFADAAPSDTDIASCIMFLTGVMAGATILDAEFTNNVIKAVEDMIANRPLNEEVE